MLSTECYVVFSCDRCIVRFWWTAWRCLLWDRTKQCWRVDRQLAWQSNMTRWSQERRVSPSVTAILKLMHWRTGKQEWPKEDASKTIFPVRFLIYDRFESHLQLIVLKAMLHALIDAANCCTSCCMFHCLFVSQTVCLSVHCTYSVHVSVCWAHQWAWQKRLNRWRRRFGAGSRAVKEPCIRSGAHWCRLANTIKWSMQGCVLSPYLFNNLVEMVMRETLDGFEGGLQIG